MLIIDSVNRSVMSWCFKSSFLIRGHHHLHQSLWGTWVHNSGVPWLSYYPLTYPLGNPFLASSVALMRLSPQDNFIISLNNTHHIEDLSLLQCLSSSWPIYQSIDRFARHSSKCSACFNSFNPQQSWSGYYCHVCLQTKTLWGSERSSNLLQITQLKSVRDGVCTQSFWFLSQYVTMHCIALSFWKQIFYLVRFYWE